jgi:uncharacterized protein YjbI with pentapeptide repeats
LTGLNGLNDQQWILQVPARSDAEWFATNFKVLRYDADFQNVDFQNVDFQNVDFQNVDVQNVDFQNDRQYHLFNPILTAPPQQGSGAHRSSKVIAKDDRLENIT